MKRIALIIILVMGGVYAAPAQTTSGEPIKTIDTLDYYRYMGKWYEVARMEDFKWEHDFMGVTVTYYKIAFRKKFVKLKEHLGYYKKSNDKKHYKLRSWIKFYDAASFKDPVHLTQGIIMLDENYYYSVVGTFDKKYAWVMCRDQNMPPEMYNKIVAKLKALGYDTSKLKKQ